MSQLSGMGGGFQLSPVGSVSQIGGDLPFGGGGAGMFAGFNPGDPAGSMAALGGSYASAYNSALAMNQANYGNIMKGYQTTMANQTSAQDAIKGGYNNLYNDVMGRIQGVDASQRQQIADTYAQQSGSATQGLINRGLYNTTVNDSLQRGLTADKEKANIALSNQMAQLQAGYSSQLGQSGLNYQNQANMQNTALSSQQLGFMNSVNAGYPDARAYAAMASGLGALQQARANRGSTMPMGGGIGLARPPARGMGGGGGFGTAPPVAQSQPAVGFGGAQNALFGQPVYGTTTMLGNYSYGGDLTGSDPNDVELFGGTQDPEDWTGGYGQPGGADTWGQGKAGYGVDVGEWGLGALDLGGFGGTG